MKLESLARIDESARVQGVALIPRISRNHNLYTKEELKRFDGVTVPLNWEHNPDKVIGEVTFHYNAENETVYYEGTITDPSASILAKNKTLYTSIEATPSSVQKICNGTTDCFAMPYGLIPEGLALTETPGVPETSVIIEKYLSECSNEFAKYGASEIIHKTIMPNKEDNCVSDQISKLSDEHPEWDHDQVVAVAHSKCGVSEALGGEKTADNIIQDNMIEQSDNIEMQIKAKNEAIELFTKLMTNYNDPFLNDTLEMLKQDVDFLTNQLIQIRKDAEFVSIESLDGIIHKMKEKYLCSCCGDVKKFV